ncbi:MAG: glycoside hydrolase family 3 N-terminal domain-containing protein [Pseudomonadota bacterium]
MQSAVVYDCEGARLSDDERAFFREADPWGFIVFARHCETPDAVRAHCDELRDCVGRDAPILIDQEGGRVTRMKTPVFPEHKPPAVFGELWRLDPKKALEAARLNAILLGRMVSDLGVTIDCVPALDVPQIDADPATVGDRALAKHPDTIAALGRAAMEGLIEGGALPVIKHMPGLGRALCDSHHELPRVIAGKDDLRKEDFAPFKALNDAPMGMTCHVVFDAYDDANPATHSKAIVEDVIRGEIGFDGLLFTDDLKMEALDGDYAARVRRSYEAGCDIALCCNFSLADKVKAQSEARPLTGDGERRAGAAMGLLTEPDRPATDAQYARLADLLRPVAAA